MKVVGLNGQPPRNYINWRTESPEVRSEASSYPYGWVPMYGLEDESEMVARIYPPSF